MPDNGVKACDAFEIIDYHASGHMSNENYTFFGNNFWKNGGESYREIGIETISDTTML
jgi:hypothetical protein